MASIGPDRLTLEVEEVALEIARIPSPTFSEADRRKAVAALWEERGLASSVDDAGNLVARIRTGATPGLLVCAHLDTVFSESVPHEFERTNGRLVGPGIGDDSLGLAALCVLGDVLASDVAAEVWVAATVGEEGLGDLVGIKHLLENPPMEIGALIAVEGTLYGRIVNRAVGSVRWRVSLQGPGGHAWHEADRPSAVHAAAQMVSALDGIGSPEDEAIAVNVGTISGGETINARAQHAQFDVDLRAEHGDHLANLVAEAELILAEDRGVDVSVEVIGDRPAGILSPGHPLVRAGLEALRAQGVQPKLAAASTDANAAGARGLPAIAVGISAGGDEHTDREWVSREHIASGVRALAETIERAARDLG